MYKYKINTDKSLKELYEWTKEIFEDVGHNPDKIFNEYLFWTIGVKYKDETFFEWDIHELYFLENFFRNYFYSKSIDNIDFIYIYSYTNGKNLSTLYTSDVSETDINIDDNIQYFRNKFAKQNKYLNIMEEGDLIYDTYYIDSTQYD